MDLRQSQLNGTLNMNWLVNWQVGFLRYFPIVDFSWKLKDVKKKRKKQEFSVSRPAGFTAGKKRRTKM